MQEVKLEQILGASREGQWVEDEDFGPLRDEEESRSDGQSAFYVLIGLLWRLTFGSHLANSSTHKSRIHGAFLKMSKTCSAAPPSDHMYYFEGKDYSKDPSSEDQKSFDRFLEEQLEEFQRVAGEGRALRHKAGVRGRY